MWPPAAVHVSLEVRHYIARHVPHVFRLREPARVRPPGGAASPKEAPDGGIPQHRNPRGLTRPTRTSPIRSTSAPGCGTELGPPRPAGRTRILGVLRPTDGHSGNPVRKFQFAMRKMAASSGLIFVSALRPPTLVPFTRTGATYELAIKCDRDRLHQDVRPTAARPVSRGVGASTRG